MYIIKTKANKYGLRPPLQTWNGDTAPSGYAICSQEFYDVFYSTKPAGFVNIQVENGVVTAMTVNSEAYDTYVSSHPVSAEVEPIDYDAVLLDHDYRILCIETGINE